MSLRDTIYASLPVALQNLAVSYEGWKIRRFRYNEQFDHALAEARDRATWPFEKLAAYQNDRLVAFVKHAYSTCPFYKIHFDQAGADLSSFRGVSDLARLPVLEKADLRARTEEIRSTSPNHRAEAEIHTSGTTGSPITIGFTQADMTERMAYLFRMLAQFGVTNSTRSVRFSGRTIFTNADKNKVFWRLNAPSNQLFMSSYHLHPENLPHYVAKLISYQPEFLDGYPSSIYVLARFINQAGDSGKISPKLIMTTAETLEPYQRDEMAKAFPGAKIVNQYASSEGAPFITEDPSGELVENIDTGVFEYVKPGTVEPAADGEPGELLVTSFTTHAYPLIRYRIGDTVTPIRGRRGKHWDMPLVAEILGRQEDLLFTPYRGYVGRMDPAFKKCPSSIIEAQIVQVTETKFELRIVPDKARYQLADADLVIDEMRSRLGPVEVEVQTFEQLPRGPNGKLRAVVGLKKFAA